MTTKTILLIFGLLIISTVISGCGQTINYDNFAKCLTEAGAVMYGTEWCSHCKSQKKAFGDSFQYIDHIDCNLEEDKCDEAGIEGYPTWSIDGNNYPGEQTMEQLAFLSGCELPLK
ncbi:hypothetical protein ACFL0W_01395 [Nanoarchaeota archaeon]